MGLRPVKDVLVMLQVSLESLGAYVLLLIVVGTCSSRAWRVSCGICCGMSATIMFVDHLVRLLARSSRPYAAEQKVGKVIVKGYRHVRNWKGITSVVLVMGSSSSSRRTGYVEFSCTYRASRPSRDVGSPTDCMFLSWLVRISWMAVSWSMSWGRYM